MKRPPVKTVDASVDTFDEKASTDELSEIGARIKAARKAVRLTQDALAFMAGATSNRGLQDNEAGKSMPGGQMIRALVRAGVNANWLLTGEGPMLLADLAPPAISTAQLINMGALEAIIEGALKITPNAPASEIASFSARLYKDCVDRGMITAEGNGPGNLNAAA